MVTFTGLDGCVIEKQVGSEGGGGGGGGRGGGMLKKMC